MPTIEFPIETVYSNFEGYAQLNQLANQLSPVAGENIFLDFSACTWFDANLCSTLGAILYQASRKLNTVRIVHIKEPIQKILSKNNFLTNYGYEPLADTFDTTIKYQRFEPQASRVFSLYLDQYFHQNVLPAMTDSLLKRFFQSLEEIFQNAVSHSETRFGIFICGQHFPNRKSLAFTITDLGIGFHQSVARYSALDYTPKKAIEWAMSGKNTARQGPVPGGLGLKLLREFILLNKGCIQVVSYNGYWELGRDGKVTTREYRSAYPGSIVNIVIKTDDTNHYDLTPIIKPDDVF